MCMDQDYYLHNLSWFIVSLLPGYVYAKLTSKEDVQEALRLDGEQLSNQSIFIYQCSRTEYENAMGRFSPLDRWHTQQGSRAEETIQIAETYENRDDHGKPSARKHMRSAIRWNRVRDKHSMSPSYVDWKPREENMCVMIRNLPEIAERDEIREFFYPIQIDYHRGIYIEYNSNSK